MEIIVNEKDLFFNSDCRALIIGSTGAIGSAIVNNLRKKIKAENVVTISRSDNGFDLMSPESIALEAGKLDGSFELILDATGALTIDGFGPEKSINAINYERMVNQFKVNAIGPALIIKHFMQFLPRRGKVVFATLSARVGSIDDNRLGGWISYRASKAALNQIIRTASIEASRKNPQSVFLAIHPGTVLSSLTKQYLGTHKYVQPDEAAQNILQVIERKDFTDSGGLYDFAGQKIPY